MKTALEILLVEDNRLVAVLTIRALKKCTLAKHFVHDGQEAIDFIFSRGLYHGQQYYEMPRWCCLI
jgi:CheY-like chemotaxis protein